MPKESPTPTTVPGPKTQAPAPPVSVAANKFRGIRAAVCHDHYTAHQAVEHDDMNVLCLGARVIGPEPAREIVASFLGARFVGDDPGQERHARRVGKVRKLEEE